MRGVAGEAPLDRAHAAALGVALAGWIHAGHHEPQVVIGMDTRESGPWLAAAVAGGLAAHGVSVRFAGLVTTPGVAYLARTGPFAAGVMISASHNPFRDNGIKVIDHSGFKMADEEELRLEQAMFAWLDRGESVADAVLTVDEGLDQQYVDYLRSTMPVRLEGLHLVVDCANGAAAHLAPELLESLGARVTRMGCAPDGRNINLDCGSLHLDRLREAVLREGADLGIAFDGDADRALFIAHSGREVDGDAVLLITAAALGAREVVATVMSNLGLEKALEARGIALIRTQVGDKYVLEEMRRRHAPLGGEQSGHIIFTRFATTGDGMLTALRVLEVIRESGRTLDQLAGELRVFPQVLRNVRVKHRRPLSELPTVQAQIAAAERYFNGSGRVLVRFSGTEPLARVMVEGPEMGPVEDWAARIAEEIRTALAS
jgi:phosphoglucosamine mutase